MNISNATSRSKYFQQQIMIESEALKCRIKFIFKHLEAIDEPHGKTRFVSPLVVTEVDRFKSVNKNNN